MEEVLDHISKELTEEESKKLLRNLGIDDDGTKKLKDISWFDPQKEFSEKLEDLPWLNLKKELELLGRKDIVKYIKNNTLITKGISLIFVQFCVKLRKLREKMRSTCSAKFCFKPQIMLNSFFAIKLTTR